MRNPANGKPGQPGESAISKVPGGASGVPTSTALAAGAAPVTQNPLLGRGPGPIPKRFRVLNGGLVMFNNVRTTIRAGKEISEKDYDVGALRKQGIKLEEIPSDVVPEIQVAPVPEESLETKPATDAQPSV